MPRRKRLRADARESPQYKALVELVDALEPHVVAGAHLRKFVCALALGNDRFEAAIACRQLNSITPATRATFSVMRLAWQHVASIDPKLPRVEAFLQRVADKIALQQSSLPASYEEFTRAHEQTIKPAMVTAWNRCAEVSRGDIKLVQCVVSMRAHYSSHEIKRRQLAAALESSRWKTEVRKLPFVPPEQAVAACKMRKEAARLALAEVSWGFWEAHRSFGELVGLPLPNFDMSEFPRVEVATLSCAEALDLPLEEHPAHLDDCQPAQSLLGLDYSMQAVFVEHGVASRLPLQPFDIIVAVSICGEMTRVSSLEHFQQQVESWGLPCVNGDSAKCSVAIYVHRALSEAPAT